MGDGQIKKVLCPHCGAEAECFCRRTTSGSSLTDKYLLWCSVCEKRETSEQPAGCRVGINDYTQKTRCPFCGRPPSEHRRCLSGGELIRLIVKREGRIDELRALPEVVGNSPACVEPCMPPKPRENLTICDEFRNLPRPPPRVVACIEPPPRRERKPVKNRGERGIIKFLIKMKSLIGIALVYALVYGILGFIAQIDSGATIATAFLGGLGMAGLAIVLLAFASIFIIWDFHRFKKGLRWKK